MVMLKINGVEDYEKLPLTKWNIRQPNADEGRENANETGTVLSGQKFIALTRFNSFIGWPFF